MPKYDVKRPVKIGGEIHKPGCKPLELDARAAAPLVESGSLVKLAAQPDGKKEPDPKSGAQTRNTAKK